MKKLFSILLVFALLALGFATAEAGRVTAKGVGQGIDGDVVVHYLDLGMFVDYFLL